MTTEHRTEVVVGFQPTIGGKVTYSARCSCGWQGTTWESRDLAQASANGHFAFQF